MITSTRNRHVAAAAKLKKRGIREQTRRFLVEGAQTAGEAVESGGVETVLYSPDAGGRVPDVVSAATRAGANAIAVSDSVMAHLTSAVTPQGLVAVARFVDVPLIEIPADRGPVTVLCSVRDPGNAGAVLRSADAAGAGGVVYTRSSVDVYNAKTVRASAGSLFHLPVAREVEAAEAVATLREAGAQILAAAVDGESSAYEVDLTRPTALLFGNEAWGLVPEVRELADRSIQVPIRGKAESLNLAAAAALLLFESARQRAAGGRPPPASFAGLISQGAHDIRLPLTALKGFAATLVDQWDRFDDESRREMVDGMLLDTERVSATIGMIVDAARMEEGRLRLTSERQDVAEALRWVADLFDRSRDYPTVEATGNAEAAFDRERLQAVLLALCEGTMWWGQEGPIEIEAGPDGGGAVIEVRRAGEGPNQAQVAAMFDAESDEGKIALHIARRVTEAMGGTLTCEGGDGVTFRLALPG